MGTDDATPKHNFSIYKLSDLKNCLKSLSDRNYIQVSLKKKYKDCQLFIQSPQQKRKPKWLKLLSDAASNKKDLNNLWNMTASFVITIATSKNSYAVAGGQGAFAIQQFIEPQFGLEIAARVLPSNRLRNIKTKLLAGQTQQEDYTYRGYFNYDIDPLAWEKLTKELIGDLNTETIQDLLDLELEGKKRVRLHAKESSFSLKKALTFGELKTMANAFDKAIKKKPLFDLVTGFKEVGSKDLRQKLNDNLLIALSKQFKDYKKDPDSFTETTIGISLNDPKVLLLCSDFKVSIRKDTANLEDFDLWELFSVINGYKGEFFKKSHLTNIKVLGADDDGTVQFEQTLRSMLYAEIKHGKHNYALIDGKWYLMTDEFLKRMTSTVVNILKEACEELPGYTMPCWKRTKDGKVITEPDYIDNLGKKSGYSVLHNKHVYIKGTDRSEICDVLDQTQSTNLLVFIKKGIKSHLREVFAQASSSALSLARLPQFSEASADKVSKVTGVKLKPADFNKCGIVLAAVDHSTTRGDKPLEEKLSTACKLDLIKAYDLIRRQLQYPIFYFCEVPQCKSKASTKKPSKRSKS